MNINRVHCEADAVVIGAGPAGAACAISLLKQGVQGVILIERGDLQHRRIGEQVSPAFLAFLRYLDIPQEAFGETDYCPCYHAESYWGSHRASARNAVFTTEHAMYQIDRERLELALIKQVADLGGRVFPRTAIGDIQQLADGGWTLQAKHADGKSLSLRTHYLVDAAGRCSSIARKLNVESKQWDHLAGVGCFVEADPTNCGNDQLIEAVEQGWWYSAPLPHQQRAVVFFTDADLVAKQQLHKPEPWLALLNASQHMKKQLSHSRIQSRKPWVKRAHSQLQGTTLPTGYLAVGDAACSFDPISSMGIGFALASGCQAATAIAASQYNHNEQPLQTYAADIQRNFSDYLENRQKIYQQEQRWPTAEFWRRRAPQNLPI